MLHQINSGIHQLKLQRLGGVPGRERQTTAAELVTLAQSLPVPLFRAAALLELADSWLVDDPDVAKRTAREARGLISEDVSPNLTALALTIEAEALSAPDHNHKAYALLQRAVLLAERQRKQVLDPMLRATSMRERIRVYDAAVRAALAVDDLEGALAASELARPKLGATSNPITIKGLQAALANDEALIIYYWLSDDRLLVTAVERTVCEATCTSVPSETLTLLSKLADHVRNAEEKGWELTDSEVKRLDLLSPALLPNIALEALGRRRKLLILAHRALHAVPFNLLRVEGQPLGLRHPFSMIPNLATLNRAVPVATDRGAVALGVGTYELENQLPSFLVAAEAIVTRHREAGLPAELIHEDGARATFLRLARSGGFDRCGFLLLACHGTSVIGDEPDRSFLVMGADRLDAGTIAELPLHVDIALLVACCSGQRAVGGRDLVVWPGDDLFGLQAALCNAGARQVIGSLWNASELPAAEMANTVHAAWLAGADAGEAVHAGATQLARRALYARLWYWAPFVAMTFGRVAALRE